MSFLRRTAYFGPRSFSVLGIETSCDDTCASIIDSDKGLLASRRSHNLISQRIIGGISPFLSAQHHRAYLDRAVSEVLDESGVRAADLAGVAVSTEPGLVICLKVGVDKALAMCRDNRVSFIPVHHMRAHSLIVRMYNKSIGFPFVALLISGGHSLICLVRGVEHFEVLGHAPNSSPGEAIDKVARELGLSPEPHYGTILEREAKCSTSFISPINQIPNITGADMDFRPIRDRFLSFIRSNRTFPKSDICCNLQHLVTAHLCQKVDRALEYLRSSADQPPKTLVIAGGVASNNYIRSAVAKVCQHWGLEVAVPPVGLTSDNAEMVAWTGMELLGARSSVVVPPTKVPSHFEVRSSSPIGVDVRSKLDAHTFNRKVSAYSLRPGSQFKRIDCRKSKVNV